MNHYIFRKKLFALLFLLIVPAFSLWNFLGARQTLSEKLRVRAAQVSQGDITLGQAVSGMETAITETVRGRMNFIEGYSFIQTLLGKEEFNNFSYVKDQEGFLHYAAFFREPDREVAGYTARLRRLADAAAEYDGKVLFTVVPSKYIPGVTQFSPGLQINDPNPLVDETLFYVNRYGIATLDMRGSIPNEALPFDKTFFRTDHHWTIPAAFEGFRQLVEALNREFDAGLDPDGFYRDPNNYTQVTYQGGMLGSMGRKTGANFAHPEDFTALWPNFSGNFYRECLEENGSTTVHQGDITQTLMVPETLSGQRKSIYADSWYSLYLNGLRYYEHIENLDNPQGPKVLFIRDSYFSPVIAFFAPLCGEIDAVWSLEAVDDLDIETMVLENQYDYIIMEVYPFNISAEAFQFFTEQDATV